MRLALVIWHATFTGLFALLTVDTRSERWRAYDVVWTVVSALLLARAFDKWRASWRTTSIQTYVEGQEMLDARMFNTYVERGISGL